METTDDTTSKNDHDSNVVQVEENNDSLNNTFPDVNEDAGKVLGEDDIAEQDQKDTESILQQNGSGNDSIQGYNDNGHDTFDESESLAKITGLEAIDSSIVQETAEIDYNTFDGQLDGDEIEGQNTTNFTSDIDRTEEIKGDETKDDTGSISELDDSNDIREDTHIGNRISDALGINEEAASTDESASERNDSKSDSVKESLRDESEGSKICSGSDQTGERTMQDSINEFSSSEDTLKVKTAEITSRAENIEMKDEEAITVETVDVDKSDGLNWVDVVGSGQLKKATLVAGSGVAPKKGQLVTIKYSMHLSNAIVVLHDMESQFILGEGEVIPALDLVVALMNVGETVCVFANSRYGYAQYGSSKHNVPQDADLEFEVTLIDVSDGPNITNMTEDERIGLGHRRRQYGNELFQDKNYFAAISCYTKALNVIEPPIAIANPSDELQSIRAKCWNNLAAAQLKIEAYDAAAKSCKNVLLVEENNVKAWFRQAKIYAAKGDLETALDSMKKAYSLDPSSKLISDEYAALKQRVTCDRKKEREIYRRMVGGTKKLTKQEDTLLSNVLSSPWKIAIGASVVAVTGILAAYLLSRR
ncbi:uncharacterized protein TRIADDRAFT_63767 [Trichoplax adhaerens]|uniref:peptidylprolyl isomerase n=1 Tax=Trichoplax adhaerens TaxID=10228 RepID=B3RSG2_TRIAD|nr:hypothetical protein TRIADDRAFT_63767 [Trichoplax adhaerens]EDV27050.1 hypothetical protein TRIADDRAFT_63767 [Trichoplax adhaerens]|eukprot:XP_002111046.1 hypothetical protein TRIADDRAFT_63767 [Trichoplax adhaerens]